MTAGIGEILGFIVIVIPKKFSSFMLFINQIKAVTSMHWRRPYCEIPFKIGVLNYRLSLGGKCVKNWSLVFHSVA